MTQVPAVPSYEDIRAQRRQEAQKPALGMRRTPRLSVNDMRGIERAEAMAKAEAAQSAAAWSPHTLFNR